MAAITIQNLVEDAPREFMTDTEKRLKRKLIALLRDDGRGHHHAKYADRLEKFDVQIVPLSADPMFTAGISFERGIILVGEGFLNDPATFYQLPVLIRHELAHNLLMHQIRMAYLLGDETYVHVKLSQSLHALHNTLGDDEISNRKYSEEDKIIIRNMMLNGILIGGLVTEDHRPDWILMSIEEMYKQVCLEIAEINAELRAGRSIADIRRDKGEDPVNRAIFDTYIYTDIDSDSIIRGSLKDFIDRGCTTRDGKQWRAEFRTIAEKIFKALADTEIDEDDLYALMRKIATSSPVEKVSIFSRANKIDLYTPEEKYIAIEVLKKFKSEFNEWRDKVISALGELNEHELQELFDMLK